jgi:hypothetical protein
MDRSDRYCEGGYATTAPLAQTYFLQLQTCEERTFEYRTTNSSPNTYRRDPAPGAFDINALSNADAEKLASITTSRLII